MSIDQSSERYIPAGWITITVWKDEERGKWQLIKGEFQDVLEDLDVEAYTFDGRDLDALKRHHWQVREALGESSEQPASVVCPSCKQEVPNIAAVRQGEGSMGSIRMGVVAVGYRCNNCGYEWGFSLPPGVVANDPSEFQDW